MIRRRRFLAALSGAALAGPIAVVAQQPAGIPRIAPCCMDQPGGRSDRGPSRSYVMRT
jgi:hypothetical protein